MAPAKPLPIETLLPFKPNGSGSSPTLSFLQSDQRRDSNLTSHSADSADDDEASANEASSDKPKRQKRSRACVACRNMKIRCLPVEGQEACRACSKVNRECIMPGPPRKRQKTVHKVAELEKKINALTDALLAKGQQNESACPDESPGDPTTTASTAPSRIEDSSNTSIDPYEPNILDKDFPIAPLPDLATSCPYERGPIIDPNPLKDNMIKDAYVDVIDQGILTMDSATTMFNYWNQTVRPTCPILHLPLGTQAHEIRQRRPMTFLAILTITSPVVNPSVHPTLSNEINRQLGERVLFHGDKSLDLAHGILLHCQYYTRPRAARDLAFNQYIHAALVMCQDLGIGKRSRARRGLSLADRTELSRTWLVCYYVSVSVATILRIPSFVKFGAHVAECLDTLSTSPHAVPSDKWLCACVGLSRIAEEVAEAFNMDDPGPSPVITDARTQYQVRYFRQKLQAWEKSAVAAPIDSRLVQSQASCINLYLLDIALLGEHDIDHPGPPEITTHHIDALLSLLENGHRTLDTYLSLEVSFARTLPNLYIVWNAYAMVILIKIHWIASSTDCPLNATLAADLKTEYYLEAILNRLMEIAADGHSPCAEAFGFLFRKLQHWHVHRGGQFSDDEPVQDEASRRQQRARILHSEPMSIVQSMKEGGMLRSPSALPATTSQRFIPDNTLGANLNAAYDAASYGNTNWDQFNFTTEEMDMFDAYMNNTGWMGYLL